MSVLTVTGTSIPDPSFSSNYTQTLSFRPALPSGPAVSAIPHNQSRKERNSYIITAQPTAPTIPHKSRQHSRTISSSTLPSVIFNNSHSPPVSHTPTSRPGSDLTKPPPASAIHSRQPSMNATMQRQSTQTSTISSLPRRSTSGRSTATNSPTSYVALMRKQKATVWCDRSQSVDPRAAAAQKAARQRAHLEVSGSVHSSGGRTSTISSGGVVGKIRHGGVPKAAGYVPANMSGASVPVRLSANEMIGDEEESRSVLTGDNSMVHGRTGSGKSSINSNKYRSGYPRPDQGRFSSTSTPPSGGDGTPIGQSPTHKGIPEEAHHDVDDREYFESKLKTTATDEDLFGELKDMIGPSATKQAMAQARESEELRRRGSVDERATTMGTVKLFVANPDIDND